jgi:hypothetical protein
MKHILFIPVFFFTSTAISQSVGVGTTTPVASSVLDMGPSAKPVILPRLTTAQMNAVTSPTLGMFLYNTTEHQVYSYMRYRTNTIIGQSSNRWQPISTGPRMLAWGVVDSFGVEINGGGTHTVVWNATDNWYELSLSNPHEYYKDSMLLMITAVGNGSWDQAIATGELIESNARKATIKFTDVSRISAGWTLESSRRRSNFHFVLYDLRKEPY